MRQFTRNWALSRRLSTIRTTRMNMSSILRIDSIDAKKMNTIVVEKATSKMNTSNLLNTNEMKIDFEIDHLVFRVHAAKTALYVTKKNVDSVITLKKSAMIRKRDFLNVFQSTTMIVHWISILFITRAMRTRMITTRMRWITSSTSSLLLSLSALKKMIHSN